MASSVISGYSTVGGVAHSLFLHVCILNVTAIVRCAVTKSACNAWADDSHSCCLLSDAIVGMLCQS